MSKRAIGPKQPDNKLARRPANKPEAQDQNPQLVHNMERAIANIGQAEPAAILGLQRTAGNRAVSGLIQSLPAPGIQAKLTVGAANDQYEQEADRVAEQVTTKSQAAHSAPQAVQRQMDEEEIQTRPLVQRQMDEEEIQTKPLVQRQMDEEEIQTKPLVQRQMDEEEIQTKPLVQRQMDEEEIQTKPLVQRQIDEPAGEIQTKPQVQRRKDGSFDPGAGFEDRLAANRGGGSALPGGLRSAMESSFGADFSGVRVHTDSHAVQMSRDIQAQSFTHGRDIYFGAGFYNPGAEGGQKLLAHELTHVVQQTGLGAAPARQAGGQAVRRATGRRIQRVLMSVATLKGYAGEPSRLPKTDKPYKKLVNLVQEYHGRLSATQARGEMAARLEEIRAVAQGILASSDRARHAGATAVIASVGAELPLLQAGNTGAGWAAHLPDPNQANQWDVAANTWAEKSQLGQQFAEDARLWYGTLFGAPGAAAAPAEQAREEAQQMILKRMFLSMAAVGLQSRAGVESSGTELAPLPGAPAAPQAWGEFPFPLAAAMSHGRRAQLQFKRGIQEHKHEGWEWLTTGHGGATAVTKEAKKFSWGNRVLNTTAGIHGRTSTHTAGSEGEKKIGGMGFVTKGLSGELFGQTAGMDVAFGGRGNLLPTANTVAAHGAAPATVGARGGFALGAGAKGNLGQDVKAGKTGQHGHMLFRPKNIKADGGQKSTVILMSMEDTAEDHYGLSGHFHDANAKPETTTVTGQTQWTHMQAMGLTQGLTANDLARMPRGYDALRAKVSTKQEFQDIQDATAKITSLPADVQKILFRHLLVANAHDAQRIMSLLIMLAASPTWQQKMTAHIQGLGQPPAIAAPPPAAAAIAAPPAVQNPVARAAIEAAVGRLVLQGPPPGLLRRPASPPPTPVASTSTASTSTAHLAPAHSPALIAELEQRQRTGSH